MPRFLDADTLGPVDKEPITEVQSAPADEHGVTLANIVRDMDEEPCLKREFLRYKNNLPPVDLS